MSADPLPAPDRSSGRHRSVRAAAGLLRDTTFRSLRHRNYRLYFFGQIVSFTGSHMQSAALMWLVYDRTDDPIWPSLMIVAQVLPTLLFGPWAGALADRTPKRRLVFRTQIGFLTTAITLVAVSAVGWADPWLLFGVQVVNGFIQAVDLPARLSFVPDLVPRIDLINAVSLNSLLFNSARAIGPAATGLMFLTAEAASGAGWLGDLRPGRVATVGCFVLNAVSFVAVLAALARIDVPGEPRVSLLPLPVGERVAALRGRVGGEPTREEDVSTPLPTKEKGQAVSPRGCPLDGLRYVLARPVLASLLSLTGLLSVFGWPALSLLPAYTRTVLGLKETEYSTLLSSLGAGALVGALATATFGTVGRRGLFLTLGVGLATAGLTGLTTAGGLNAAICSTACLGFGLILFLSTAQSALQLSATDDARGRVMVLWAMTLSGSAPFGHFTAGLIARKVGVTPVLTGMTAGVGCVAAVVLAVTLVRGWKVR